MDQPISEGFALAFIMITLILTIGSVLRGIFLGRKEQRIAELRTQMQAKLLERFENSNEALEFLRSEAGIQFAASNTLERSNAHAKILNSLHIGIVATFVGIALFAVRANMSQVEMRDTLIFLGAVATSLGLGFVVSSLVGLLLTRKLAESQDPTSLSKLEVG